MAKPRRKPEGMVPSAADWREALQWFVNTYGLYYGSMRGLFLSDWTEDQAVSIEAAVINLKSRGFAPFVVSGETLYQQADFLFAESREKATFGRPLASKVELELSGSEIVIVDGLEAPEKPSHLWYLMYYLLFPRAISGKATILTTPLSYPEFLRYGQACADLDFAGKPVNFEKLKWLIEACTINQELFKLAREESVPPMLKSEFDLYLALRERGLDIVPQQVLGDYLLDFAIVQGDNRLNIECDILSALAGHEINTRDAKRDLVLLSDGWQILKFSTAELLNDPTACADVVEDTWRGGRKRSHGGRLLSGKSLPSMPELSTDDAQRTAIVYGGGPFALMGGSGTGKSTCISQRVAFLLSQGVSPDNILVISYSVDTARLLKQTTEKLVDKQLGQQLNIVPWHDLGMRILRENLPAIKRKPPLKLEPSPQKVIQKLLTKLRKEYDPVKLEMAGELDEFYVSAVIAMYKSYLITPKMAKDDANGDAEELIAKIYQSYEDQLLKINRIDRNDVCSLAVQVLLENPELRNKYQSVFEFVLVDEYQEATVAQDMLARILASPQDNLFLAGDEDETISESRNACPDLLGEVSFRFPNARCMVLEQNWRCHPTIVDHSRQLLSNLQRRKIQKEFVSAWGAAPSSAIFGPQPCSDEAEEVAWVASQVKAQVDAGRNAGHIAILYRQNQYESMLEAELVRIGVRFHASYSDNSMIPDEVGDMVAFLKLVMDPDGPRAREAFERVSQLGTKEIDPKLSATIASFAGANNLSYLKAIEIYAEATADQGCRELEQLVKVIRAMNQDRLPPSESIGYLRRTRRLNDYYKSIKIPPGQVYEPLKKLGQLEDEARKFASVAEFVQHVEERVSDFEEDDEEQGVHIKSVLDIKGYEFPIVFFVGLADGFLPLANSPDIEEERRQFYVAFTRAKEAIFLSYPVRSAGRELGPSRFLVEALLAAAPPPQAYAAPVQQAPVPVAQASHVTEPIVQVQPVVQAPVQHVQAPQTVQPVQYAPPVEAAQPVPQTLPPQPAMPAAQPAQPAPDVQPSQPVIPPVQPMQPAMPVQPMQANYPAVPTQPAQPTYVEPIMPVEPLQPAMPASQQVQTGKEDKIRYQASPVPAGATMNDLAPPSPPLQPAAAPVVEEVFTPGQAASIGDPLAQKPKVSGLSPYVEQTEPAPDRGGMRYLPPSKTAAEKKKEADDEAAAAAALAAKPKEASVIPKPDVYSPVPPGPPPPPSMRKIERPRSVTASTGSGVAPEPPVAPEQPPTMPQVPLPTSQVMPVQATPMPQVSGHGHEYRTAVDPAALHALRGDNAFLSASLHGHVGAKAAPSTGGPPICPSCANPLEANARFCGECGYSLPERIPACVACANPLEPGAKFCGECGTPAAPPPQASQGRPSDKPKGSWMIKFLKFLEN